MLNINKRQKQEINIDDITNIDNTDQQLKKNWNNWNQLFITNLGLLTFEYTK